MSTENLAIVSSPEEVFTNIKRYQQELPRSDGLRKRVSMHRGWYAFKDESGRWLFAPSKFVGYADNTAKRYLDSYDSADGMDGRETEPALKQWFEVVEKSHPLFARLHGEFSKFASGLDKSPSRIWRVSILRNHLAESVEAPAFYPPKNVSSLQERIALDPDICGGRPCIKGTRMRVGDIVDMIASGASQEDILEDFPYLEKDDIAAALKYAARALDHAVVRAA